MSKKGTEPEIVNYRSELDKMTEADFKWTVGMLIACGVAMLAGGILAFVRYFS